MDLMCPHCQRRVTVSDDKAGQVASCPLCAKQFMAPMLPTAPAPVLPPAPPVVAPPSESYPVGPAPVPPLSSSAPGQPEPASPPPPVPPGEYTRTCSLCLSGSWLVYVAPSCLGAIFFLSFFPWHAFRFYWRDQLAVSLHESLWGLSFTEAGYARFLAYTLLMMPTTAVVIAAMLFDKGWLHAPPPLAPYLLWKNLAAGALLVVTFLLLCVDYCDCHVAFDVNPIALAMKLAFRLHFAAALASFGMFWLDWRKQRNLPLPKVELRW